MPARYTFAYAALSLSGRNSSSFADVCVSHRGLALRVTEQRADRRQRHAARDQNRIEALCERSARTPETRNGRKPNDPRPLGKEASYAAFLAVEKSNSRTAYPYCSKYATQSAFAPAPLALHRASASATPNR